MRRDSASAVWRKDRVDPHWRTRTAADAIGADCAANADHGIRRGDASGWDECLAIRGRHARLRPKREPWSSGPRGFVACRVGDQWSGESFQSETISSETMLFVAAPAGVHADAELNGRIDLLDFDRLRLFSYQSELRRQIRFRGRGRRTLYLRSKRETGLSCQSRFTRCGLRGRRRTTWQRRATLLLAEARLAGRQHSRSWLSQRRRIRELATSFLRDRSQSIAELVHA